LLQIPGVTAQIPAVIEPHVVPLIGGELGRVWQGIEDGAGLAISRVIMSSKLHSARSGEF